MTAEYVYLLIEREFIHKNEPVYKIGQTKNLKTRIRAYPKNSKLVLSFIVNNCKVVERSIMKVFKEKFKQRLDIGTEYFEGHLEEIKSAFEEIVLIENAKPSDQRSMTSDDQQPMCECGVLCTSNYKLERHRRSRSHESNLLCGGVFKQNGLYTCNLCNYSTLRKDNFRKHVKSAKHKSAKERDVKSEDQEKAAGVRSLQNQVVQPVMLFEVMEMFLNHMKDESIQNRQYLKNESIKKNDLFKLFADRITAHEESIQHRGLQCVVKNAETVTNTINK